MGLKVCLYLFFTCPLSKLCTVGNPKLKRCKLQKLMCRFPQVLFLKESASYCQKIIFIVFTYILGLISSVLL